MFNQGATLDRKNQEGTTPLIAASINGYQETVALLLQLNADFNAVDNRGKTAMDYAADKGYSGIVEQLIMHQAD